MAASSEKQGAMEDPTHVEIIQNEQSAESEKDIEQLSDTKGNLIYDNIEEEPELHFRTYIAFGSMFLLNYVQVVALQGPPAVLSYIGDDLNGTVVQTWVPNALSLVQAVLGPVISSGSDTFQARKTILVASCVISFIGSGIAPGSQSIYRLIGAQILIGVGFAAVPLAYVVPSEILPRKWRPMAQSIINIAASLGAISGPLAIGGLTNTDPINGWRNFYWIQFALWGVTALGIFVAYRPPKRHTRLDHLTLWQKIGKMDLAGFFLLTAGLALLLTGLNLGGGLYAWSDARVLSTLIVGAVTLIGFGLYEWKGTKEGILHHELFKGGKARGQTFALCVVMIFIEGILLFSFIVFYPQLTGNLFEQNPLLLVARSQPFWIACGISTVLYGYAAIKLRSIRIPMGVGFILWTAGEIGLATVEPGQNVNPIVLGGLAGLGFGAPLVLVVAGVQLSVPHHLIATATAVTTSARAVAATMFTAIYAAALSDRIKKLTPKYVGAAAIAAGLNPKVLPEFIPALAAHNQTAIASIPGVTPGVLADSTAALMQAFADSIRVVYIIGASFGALGVILCFFLGDLSKTMNYRVDAPVEDLHAKHHS